MPRRIAFCQALVARHECEVPPTGRIVLSFGSVVFEVVIRES